MTTPKTKVITVQVTRIPELEKLLKRRLAVNQVPLVKLRVSVSELAKIRKMLKAGKCK